MMKKGKTVACFSCGQVGHKPSSCELLSSARISTARINIGGLPWEASEDDVKKLLREHSVDEVKEVVKQYDHEGRYYGCMLATLYSADVAQNAIDRLNNIAFMNQNIWVKWFGAGWPSMRGPSNGQNKKHTGRVASKSAPRVKSDAREIVSHSGSWCYACNRWRNMAGECGCQPQSQGLSHEELYRQQWMSFYQSSYLGQGYNNQVQMFPFPPPVLKPIFIPPPGPVTNQQTGNDLHTGSGTLLPEAGFVEEPCPEQVLPSSGTPPPPPGTSPPPDLAQRPESVETSDSKFAFPVPTTPLSKTQSEKSIWDVQSVVEQGEVNVPKEDMAGRKNHEIEGKKVLEEKIDLNDVNAVDSDLASALAGLLKEERREKKIVARRWRCLQTEQQPQSDTDSSTCTPSLPDLATVYARLQREENKAKRRPDKKRKKRQSESGGDSASQPAEPMASSSSGSPVAVDPSLVRCDYCPLPGLLTKDEVNQHLKETHGQVLFSCSFCSSSFPFYFEAEHHVKTKHNGRGSVVRPVDHLLVTHKCLRCQARFTSMEEAEVRDHVKKAHNGWATIRWECRLCGESFPGKQEFEEHLSGRHASILAKTTTELVEKVPFLHYWKKEVEKKENKLMTEELKKRKTLKFKMTSSDSSSSSSEEEADQPGMDNKLQRFVQRKTRKYFESQECLQVKGGFEACHHLNPGNETVEEKDVRLKKYKTLRWACAFVASSEKEESRELSIRKKVAPIGEIHPKDFFRQKKKRKKKVTEKEDKSSGECSTSESEGSSQDSDGANSRDQFDEEKLLVLQTRLEKALRQKKVLTKRDEKRLKKVEEYDAYFTDGFLLEDEEAAAEVSSEVEDNLRKGREDVEVQESNVEESAVERNNNIKEEKRIGLDGKALELEQRSLSEWEKGRGEIVMDGKKMGQIKGEAWEEEKNGKDFPTAGPFSPKVQNGMEEG